MVSCMLFSLYSSQTKLSHTGLFLLSIYQLPVASHIKFNMLLLPYKAAKGVESPHIPRPWSGPQPCLCTLLCYHLVLKLYLCFLTAALLAKHN